MNYINSNYIVRFNKYADGSLIYVDEAGKLTPYHVSETPEQLMDALREEPFPVEQFMEELKDTSSAIPISGRVLVN